MWESELICTDEEATVDQLVNELCMLVRLVSFTGKKARIAAYH
jgi:hypothetical protein